MWFVFEAEYEINEHRRADWNRPVRETIVWHGPFATQKEADETALARMWARIDSYNHKARVIDLTVRD